MGAALKVPRWPGAAWLHVALTVIWVVLAVPTFLWWRESVTWVVTMSWYAIVVGHWSAVEAARPNP